MVRIWPASILGTSQVERLGVGVERFQMFEVEVEVVAPGGVDEEGGVDGEPGVDPGHREHAESHITGALEEQEGGGAGEVEQERWRSRRGGGIEVEEKCWKQKFSGGRKVYRR